MTYIERGLRVRRESGIIEPLSRRECSECITKDLIQPYLEHIRVQAKYRQYGLIVPNGLDRKQFYNLQNTCNSELEGAKVLTYNLPTSLKDDRGCLPETACDMSEVFAGRLIFSQNWPDRYRLELKAKLLSFICSISETEFDLLKTEIQTSGITNIDLILIKAMKIILKYISGYSFQQLIGQNQIAGDAIKSLVEQLSQYIPATNLKFASEVIVSKGIAIDDLLSIYIDDLNMQLSSLVATSRNQIYRGVSNYFHTLNTTDIETGELIPNYIQPCYIKQSGDETKNGSMNPTVILFIDAAAIKFWNITSTELNNFCRHYYPVHIVAGCKPQLQPPMIQFSSSEIQLF